MGLRKSGWRFLLQPYYPLTFLHSERPPAGITDRNGQGVPWGKCDKTLPLHRHVGLLLSRLASFFLSCQDARTGIPQLLQHPVPGPGNQQHLLPPAARVHPGAVTRPHPGGVRLRRQGKPLHHPHQASRRAGSHRPPLPGTGSCARPETRPGPLSVAGKISLQR